MFAFSSTPLKCYKRLSFLLVGPLDLGLVLLQTACGVARVRHFG